MIRTAPVINADTVYQFGYSDRNRLVNVNQIDNNICVNRAYTFDNTGNRTQKVTSLLNADNNLCGIPISGETPVTESLSYNDYSQLTNTGYVYDIFGRATTIPSADTANGAGNVTIGYSIEDRITSQKQGATQTDYSYDALGRRYQDKQNTVVQVTRHYSDESDNPNWVTSGPVGAITQTDVFTPSLGNSLNITRTTKTGATTAYLNFATYTATPSEASQSQQPGMFQHLQRLTRSMNTVSTNQSTQQASRLAQLMLTLGTSS